ncbi:N-acetylglucosamine-6-phosphate deacetylase [Cohnella sp. CFH 77786]|uniref:N-acetylglucosamine-6-phosphate deacetylase n=1 Tax=Cohnella sp. CFH 77786 TaxID=2662265 RepID=UPI001C60B26A|nr:N-acetylglucosamine-6-phosphate deacetylase [Cohnella sp. CFH 77786]MBW5447974.1 N-acetylglucosamine-6-phosphate deacetylase [Cohnella sp. CFH 77786]
MNGAIGMDRLIVGAKIVTPAGILEDGWLWMRHGIIAGLGGVRGDGGVAGAERPPAEAENAVRVAGSGGWVLPGFIDMHVHGGAGHDFMDAEDEELRAITRFHGRHGTTGMLATSMTAPRENLSRVLERVSRFIGAGMPYARLLGVHIEGPFVSLKWKGAQNPAYILPPRLDWLEDWIRDYPGLIRMQTLAPETEGAPAYIERLAAAGAVPACGHTDATYDELVKAADRGLRHAVHTFNAMRPYHHREPGTVGAVLTDDRIMAEVIADGHHVHPAGIKLLVAAKGVDRVILVTDAMAAAGMPDGDYEIGGLPVVMAMGVARLKDGDSLAGSTLTMVDAFRFMVREVGVSVPDASKMASANPARQLGLAREVGTLEAGKRADVLLLDGSLTLRGVWVGGSELRE